MSLTPRMPEPTAAVAGALRRFTLDEYHRMIELGILGEDDDVELLEGLLVEKIVRKPRHDAAVSLVHAAIAAKLPPTLFCRIQSAITTLDSEPEPDVAVVRSPARSYVDRHPQPSDVVLIVEVAEASLDRDRRDKARLYARAGVLRYWILNLVDGEVEVCTEPSPEGSYARRSTMTRAETVQLDLGPVEQPLSIQVADLLP